ncbi:nucleotidyltransferase domain-containing protein [Desulfoscipio geothermicus]|uniref:Polymerase nucleotidyl transferase domain-containing protein n=1 Tax=Desulfoscipio geothermicus DSM 3669 TaxID=1121426 RepID=A0A1I6D7W2_9FIRM|nr:nucleotidyltransferase domain-containing protein [Desulfoscipio geothermicus]SFR01545.1 hypothetical protein SAMN05660706_1072 [Desulfoscipio geothermicus DSM 3669]
MPETTNQVSQIIKSYLTVLAGKGVPVQKAYLFGSQAKGTAGPNSDIDLIVVSPAFAGMPLWQRFEKLGDALAEVMEPIEVRGYTPEEINEATKQKASFLYEVLNESQTLEYQL